MENSSNQVLFSALQPSGKLTIGNYVGVLSKFNEMQKYFSCVYCIADHHAITVKHNPDELKKNILDMLAIFLACGVDTNKSIIFVQSHVPQHFQLCWILNCYTHFNELVKMTQFKEKSKINKENINSGLLNYPVLMASDILLYNSNFVLVGPDQKQHIELSRKIAKRFNKVYGNIFTVPNRLLLNSGKQIFSLQNPRKKMSKSDQNPKNVIFLLENIKSSLEKLKLACTDSEIPPKIYYDLNKKPGISNLINLLSCITGKSISYIENNFHSETYKNFKSFVSDIVSDFLRNIQNKFFHFRKNEDFLKNILLNGSNKAKEISKITLEKVMISIGSII
ncbi:tryptophan--tRNA ligase [Candidatus Riesia sp. GBBU]|nr:tryptophan--tRNA ligase [Candidatus Riesia sp. GBBU]ARC55076.1 tryptophan--tRNA ligase [Candidatus Riesia sp. GBBU]